LLAPETVPIVSGTIPMFVSRSAFTKWIQRGDT
jgi:hypothetical protein